ncbi:MAG: short-chain fatty acyl-CoA regulator family protein [Alphaproteobacteria bacterium]|nr:short-chain fatty acyl-CoA regulator family protein [Alphaproteobacteria bacterium]
MPVEKKAMLGHKVRRYRQEQNLSQTEMAEMLEISPSYLNLIEHNQRPMTVPLLFRLGQAFPIDLREFAEDEAASLAAGLREVLSDPLFEGLKVRDQEIREVAEVSPTTTQAIMTLYKAYANMREDTQALVERLADPTKMQGLDTQAFPLEEVRDFQQSQSNHFPELETAAEALWLDAELDSGDLFQGLARHLHDVHDIGAKIMPVDIMGETLRRYDFHRRRVLLSEMLPPSGRNFQLAVQLALTGQGALLDRLVAKANLSSPDAEKLCRIGLAGYFAGALLMPYDRFLASAKELRYDLEILQNRFGVSFEQVCHRLTTLQRSGSRGVPFFFIRVDNAGNISKRLSGAGFQFARFGGTCPRWVIHDAFGAPGTVHTQQARMPDGSAFLTIARTVDPVLAGHNGQQPRLAVAVGCDISQAKTLVYGAAMDLKNKQSATEVGVSCRVCERLDCGQRAHPPLNHRLRLDENVRRIAPFAIAPS